MIRSALTALIAFVCVAASPRAARAQDAALVRVHELIATGRFTDADNTLAQWERGFQDPRSAATPTDRARAVFLRALLTADAKQAEDLFVSIVLSHPSTAVAPDALLRLGQSLLTGGEPRRAVAYLERLRSDYPGAPARQTGMLWLARAQLAGGSADAACRTATAAARTTADAFLRRLIDIERERSCTRS